MKVCVYKVESLVQAARAYKAAERIHLEISTLHEAFERLKATKKVGSSW